MFIKKLLSIIGDFFKGVFNAAAKAYNKLPKDQQLALQQGAWLTEILNQTIGRTSHEIHVAIFEKYPNLEKAKLEEAVDEIAKIFNIPANQVTHIDDLIVRVQQHLAELDGKAWACASNAAANIFATIFGPQIKVATITCLMEYVYRAFVKKEKE